MNSKNLIVQATMFAAEKHQGQIRKGNANIPYINHPIKVAFTLNTVAGVNDESTICAALLHDVIEDTDTTFNDLKNVFGEKIATIVLEVSDDKNLTKAIRKSEQIVNAPNLSYEAKLIRIADKVCNIQDVASKNSPEWNYDRKYDYLEWAKQVVDSIKGTHEALEDYFFDEHRWGRTNLGV